MNVADNGPREDPQPLTVSVGLHENVIVARTAGELDYVTAVRLHRKVEDAWQAAPSAALVMDLDRLTFCDSSGLSVLVQLLHQSQHRRGELVLAAVPPHLDHMLTLTGLRAVFRVQASAEDAVRAVRDGDQ